MEFQRITEATFKLFPGGGGLPFLTGDAPDGEAAPPRPQAQSVPSAEGKSENGGNVEKGTNFGRWINKINANNNKGSGPGEAGRPRKYPDTPLPITAR